jgi:hypothetical protein
MPFRITKQKKCNDPKPKSSATSEESRAEGANRFIHGKTHNKMRFRFDKDLFTKSPVDIRKAARDAYISGHGSRYSVLWLYAVFSIWPA